MFEVPGFVFVGFFAVAAVLFAYSALRKGRESAGLLWASVVLAFACQWTLGQLVDRPLNVILTLAMGILLVVVYLLMFTRIYPGLREELKSFFKRNKKA